MTVESNSIPIQSRMVAFVIAGLFFVSAGLKATAGLTAVAPFGLPSVGTTIAILTFELILGLWLLTGLAVASAWWVTTFTFVGFAAFSLANTLNRVECCGCFGDAELSPWWVLRLDLAVLIALGLTWRGHRGALRNGMIAGISLVIASSFVGFIISGFLAKSGTSDMGWQAWHGQTVVSEQLIVDFGERPGGIFALQEMTVINRGDRSITLLGMKTDCSISTASSFPFIVPPGESIVVHAALKFPSEAGFVSRIGEIYVNSPSHPPITFRLCGRSAGSSPVSKGTR